MFKKSAIIVLAFNFIILGAWHLVESIQKWNPEFISNDKVSYYDNRRLAALRANLPAHVKTVGYIDDLDVLPFSKSRSANDETELVLTQYVLAPVIVNRGDNAEWVILNLTPQAYDTWIQQQPQNIQVTDCGFRIFLVHKP
jgi:hypothetical protein